MSPLPDRFELTLFPAPELRPGGDPNQHADVLWPRWGRRVSPTLSGLVALLTRPVPAPGKFVCPHFHCATLRDNRRLAACFERASVIALDIDGGLTLGEAHAVLRRWFYVVYTSWRHAHDAHRFRVVLPLARSVDAPEYRTLWAWLGQELGRTVDPQTGDLGRVLLLPAVRPDGTRAQAKAWEQAPLLCPDAVLAVAPPWVPPQAVVPPRPLRPVTLPPHAAAAEARLRLNTSEEVRRRAAVWLGAQVGESRADRAPCPRCDRRSVWFFLRPGKLTTAQCNHKSSCGWWGHLDELLNHAGAAHVQ